MAYRDGVSTLGVGHHTSCLLVLDTAPKSQTKDELLPPITEYVLVHHTHRLLYA